MSTTRLGHSPIGFLRYMQMSRAAVFAFVEGKEVDPFIYGQICSAVCERKYVDYELCRANQIPPYAGGKSALLVYHDFLRRRKALRTDLKGKVTIAAFFVDKDIDDTAKRCRRSRHIIYTRFYDMHNEIFINGNILRGCAAASSLDPARLKPMLCNSQQWCKQVAERWQDWVVLCVIAALKDIDNQCNYRVVSQVQCSITGCVDPRKLSSLTAQMRAKSGMLPAEFASFHKSVSRRIRRLYRSGQHDRVFKGKWYSTILNEDVKRLMGGG